MSLPNSRPLDNSCELNRMVKRLYTSPNKGFIEVGPCNVFMINNFEQVYDGIKNLTVYDDDVFLLGFPKSGTRWTQEMVWLICNDFDYEGAKETILTRRFPTLEFDGVTHYNINITKTISEMKRPRLLKTHLPWSLCPDDITSYSKKPKFIVVTRTPEDVCLSMFYHARTSQGFTGSFEEFCILFLAGKGKTGRVTIGY
uniref:Sulfotransferase domain-containing protein n=1 Tax=Photinus pyralis TaxID=7054 RepID=A0A1Y1MN96_PHOPY